MVEIVKREHLERLEARKSPSLVGVHQYDEILTSSLPSSPHVTENAIRLKVRYIVSQSRQGFVDCALIQHENQEDCFYENHALQEETSRPPRQPRGNVSRNSFVANRSVLTKPYRYRSPLPRTLSRSAKARAGRRQRRTAPAVGSTTAEAQNLISGAT